ncbi:MAG: EAL domain-containing protein [Gammaproteobacteria bacterium]|nr:EAL domain-containing protein [Gammaproteobacteria bacterium]
MQAAREEMTRILLIEDDEADYELTCAMLDDVSGVHYEIDWARDYDDGLKAIRAGAHDVCLLDNRLGGRSGLDLLDACGGAVAALPIIILTGVADRQVDEAAMGAGAADFLVKDQLSPNILERAIRYATERHRLRAELERLAKYDALTGLASRVLFQDFLDGAMARADRGKRPLALLFLDLDHFKYINDTFGHVTGDALLAAVAQRLKTCVRTGDLVARLGGDEFAIILDDIGTTDNAARVARNIVEALKQPCEIAGHEIHAQTSIGIALYPNGVSDSAELIKAADTAMYEAKRQGRNTYRFFAPSMQQAARVAVDLEAALAQDVAKDQFAIHFQPQVDAATGIIVGMEALARWRRHPPSTFIPAAERSGLIIPLGDRLLQRACTHFSRWWQSGLAGVDARLSVNISAVQLKGDILIESVLKALEASGLPAHALELELTETAMMDDPDNAVAVLEQLDRLGVIIVTDDFGTGYSSLTYLNRLPIRALKIDYSFVKDIGIDEQSETIIKATIGLTQNLGLDVVAEGVETEAQAAFLLDNGCHVMQGWLFSRALPPEAMERRLAAGPFAPLRFGGYDHADVTGATIVTVGAQARN